MITVTNGLREADYNGDGGGPDGFGSHRYSLRQQVSAYLPNVPRRLVTIGLNPSKASHLIDDRTIAKELKFARSWQMDTYEKVNFFPHRATDPLELLDAADPTGDPDNLACVLHACRRASLIVCAWGGPYGPARLDKMVVARAVVVLRALNAERLQLHVLKLTKDGIPRHTLYLKDSSTPVLWSGP